MDIYGVYTDQEEAALKKEAYKFAASIDENNLEDAIEHYNKQDAEVEDMLTKDYYTANFNEEEAIHYARILVRIRYLLFYMRRRFVGDVVEDMEEELKEEEAKMDDLVNAMGALGK